MFSQEADSFGQQLSADWQGAAGLTPFYEVMLFRKLTDVLRGLSNRFRIEEYHGSGHQVEFDQLVAGTYQCELCDLMILVYQPSPFRVRLTHLQAKRHSGDIPLCKEFPDIQSAHGFTANYRQWDLLHRRPVIRGLGAFSPPADLLSGALLKSVGSYGVFHNGPGNHVFHYSSADLLDSSGCRSRFRTTLTTPVGHTRRDLAGYGEITSTCCMHTFGAALHDGFIGTPLEPTDTADAADADHRARALAWVGSILGYHLSRPLEDERSLGAELIDRLGGATSPVDGVHPNLFIIKTDHFGPESFFGKGSPELS